MLQNALQFVLKVVWAAAGREVVHRIDTEAYIAGCAMMCHELHFSMFYALLHEDSVTRQADELWQTNWAFGQRPVEDAKRPQQKRQHIHLLQFSYR